MKDFEAVEPGVVMITMSLNAISATALVMLQHPLMKIGGTIVFILSGVGAAQLYWSLVSNHIACFHPEYITIKKKSVYLSTLWVLKFWLKLSLEIITFRATSQKIVLSGYLNVWFAFVCYLILILGFVVIKAILFIAF
jgi:hypothetical protein